MGKRSANVSANVSLRRRPAQMFSANVQRKASVHRSIGIEGFGYRPSLSHGVSVTLRSSGTLTCVYKGAGFNTVRPHNRPHSACDAASKWVLTTVASRSRVGCGRGANTAPCSPAFDFGVGTSPPIRLDTLTVLLCAQMRGAKGQRKTSRVCGAREETLSPLRTNSKKKHGEKRYGSIT